MWVHCAASPQHTVYLNLLIWPTLCQWFPLRWKQYHVNYHDHLVRAVKKSFLFLSQICTCQSKTASNKPLGLRHSGEEPRSSLGGFRSGVKLIFSWQFDSPLSLCCCSTTIIIDFGVGFLIRPVSTIYGCLAWSFLILTIWQAPRPSGQVYLVGLKTHKYLFFFILLLIIICLIV